MGNTCSYVQVGDGEGCWDLAQRCDISVSDFYSYNNLTAAKCDFIKPREAFCCEPGVKPDLRPQPLEDGTCFSVTIEEDVLCWNLQDEYFLTEEEIEKFNDKKTWGWSGCGNLQLGQTICLSEGNVPMPAPIDNAICGPQKPGTKKPSGDFDGFDLAKLNPCPLNVCCNIWGQCGTTPDFCTKAPGDSGAPGTSQPGKNSCISNCETKIMNNDKGPDEFSHVAYFEAWNHNRKCLHMDVTEIDTSFYTHIHFSFGTITPDFKINVDDIQEQFDMMKTMKDIKKIISFGGWAFSTEDATINIFRSGIREENRDFLCQGLVDFVNEHELDGLDIDLEYPSALDLGFGEEDADNYLEFLKVCRKKLPASKSLSIAAPASYWYLRHFPIKEMAEFLDYIIYMTYDLHGQWDVGNEWASPGCPGGNCLRSHVNSTETYDSLVMITKAGVPSYKIFVGVTSYGRSFKMSQKGCTGPDCFYEGARNESPAMPGRCTDTGGYLSDAEIYQIMEDVDNGHSDFTYKRIFDEDSDSDILVYNDVEWVAFMSPTTKQRRIGEYKDLNMGGSSDWAVDLQINPGFARESNRNATGYVADGCDGTTWDSLDELEAETKSYRPECMVPSLLEIFHKMLDDAVDLYGEVNQDYDDMYEVFAEYTKDSVNDVLDSMMYEKRDGSGGELLKHFKCFAAKSRRGPREDADEVPCDDLPSGGFGTDWTYWFELKDEAGYNKTLAENGMDPEWVEFGSERKTGTVCNPPSSLCMNTWRYYIDYPRRIEREEDINVVNPKDIVSEGFKSVPALKEEFDEKWFEVSVDAYEGDPTDIIQVLSVPVYMLTDAVAAMKEVKEMGKKIEEEKRKNFILNIISALLFFIPFVGGAVGAAGRAGVQIARFAFAFELAGSTALSIYEIAENPESAPVAIMGMIAGAVGLRSPRKYNSLASAKTKIKGTADGSMGNSWKEIDPRLQSIVGNMCRV